MAKHRSHSIEFKRQVAQEFLGGETLHGLAKRHDLSRNLIRIWVEEVRGRRLRRRRRRRRPDPGVRSADRRARAAGRPSGARAGVSKGGSEKRTPAEKRSYIRDHRPRGLSIAEGCRLMGIARSTYYDAPAASGRRAIVTHHRDLRRVRSYGWRRVGGASPSRHDRQPKAEPPDARARSAAAPPQALYRHHRQ